METIHTDSFVKQTGLKICYQFMFHFFAVNMFKSIHLSTCRYRMYNYDFIHSQLSPFSIANTDNSIYVIRYIKVENLANLSLRKTLQSI